MGPQHRSRNVDRMNHTDDAQGGGRVASRPRRVRDRYARLDFERRWRRDLNRAIVEVPVRIPRSCSRSWSIASLTLVALAPVRPRVRRTPSARVQSDRTALASPSATALASPSASARRNRLLFARPQTVSGSVGGKGGADSRREPFYLKDRDPGEQRDAKCDHIQGCATECARHNGRSCSCEEMQEQILVTGSR